MKELTNISKEAVLRYFKALSILGYMDYSEVDKVIVLTYIEELLNTLSIYVTEEDYKDINKCLNCLYGSNCMIDMPSYNSYDELLHRTDNFVSMRITEDLFNRFTENDMLRIKA